jgi:uncharacterized protein YuzE
LEEDMKIEYDETVDVLSIYLAEGVIAESDEGKPGIILDYDAAGNVLSVEILDASKRLANPRSVELAITH